MTPTERLLALADLLEADPATWPRPAGDDRPPAFDLADWRQTTDCGTACCAAGLAGLYPPFQALGFALADDPRPVGGIRHSYPAYRAADGDLSHNWAALSLFFGLGTYGPRGPGRPAVRRAFAFDSYPAADHTNPRAVAARLRRLAAGDPVDDWDSWKTTPQPEESR